MLRAHGGATPTGAGVSAKEHAALQYATRRKANLLSMEEHSTVHLGHSFFCKGQENPFSLFPFLNALSLLDFDKQCYALFNDAEIPGFIGETVQLLIGSYNFGAPLIGR
jgi:hypothetical protein